MATLHHRATASKANTPAPRPVKRPFLLPTVAAATHPIVINHKLPITDSKSRFPSLLMTYRTIRIAAWCTALLIAALAIRAWLSSRDEQQRLQSTLATQKQLLGAADAREHARETVLNETLAQIEKLKRTTQTPDQVLRDLPKYLSLPQPITLARPPSSTPRAGQQGTDLSKESPAALAVPPSAPSPSGVPPPPASVSPAQSGFPSAPVAQIPTSDLKPLYDFVQDCRACQARLAAAKENALDDNAKMAALTRERDAAITAAKGGSFWRRLRRNTLWFVIGAGFGAATGYATAKR
jgi:type II secretory pathway pseudopilin PulG